MRDFVSNTDIYWLGGGSGAGKSTIARKIAERFNFHYYSTDDHMFDHASRCSQKDAPLLHAFKQMDMDERWVNRSPQIMFETFHWYQGEGFECIIEDLMELPTDRPVIVEGFRLLPDLVAANMISHRHALWLLPDAPFRRKAFESRGTLWDIANKTSKPEKALSNLLVRDALFTDFLRFRLSEKNLASIEVDEGLDENALFDTVCQHFQLA